MADRPGNLASIPTVGRKLGLGSMRPIAILICEGTLRLENGKEVLIGVWPSDTIVLPSPQPTVPFMIWAQVDVVAGEDSSFEFRLIGADGYVYSAGELVMKGAEPGYHSMGSAPIHLPGMTSGSFNLEARRRDAEWESIRRINFVRAVPKDPA